MSPSSPPPPARPRARRPRGSLSRELILDAAEAVARHGFEELTLRAVAAQLGAAPMALYRYFATKEELVNALLDRVLSRFAPESATGDWGEDLRRFARAHRRMLDQHPWALGALFSHPNPGLSATRIGEFALAILTQAGFSIERTVATFSGLIALNYGWSAFASARDVDSANAAEQVRAALGALSPAEYRLTARVASEMSEYGSDRHYELVIAQMLAGIRSAAQSTE